MTLKSLNSKLSRSQVLLKPNRRALAAGCLIPAVSAAACLGIMTYCRPDNMLGILGFATCGLILVFCFVMIMGLITMAFLPRIAMTADHLLVYMRGYHPYRIPLEAVECFFQGQGRSALTASDAKSTNVIVRLAERASDWHRRTVRPSLGEWNDGYITIRGTWCERITETKLRALNAHLASVKRARRDRPDGGQPTSDE